MFNAQYLLLVALPTIILAMWAQAKVRGAMAKFGSVPSRCRMTGAELAAAILRRNGVANVTIEETTGWLGDHYDPSARVLRLTPPVFNGRSVAAAGIAAHEAGHALQQAHAYAPLVLRTAIVPMAAISNLAWPLLIIGILFKMTMLIPLAIILFLAAVVLQVVNLPVEYNASRRAREALNQMGIVSVEEQAGVRAVLNAAALTYVAAALGSILQLLYFIGVARRSS